MISVIMPVFNEEPKDLEISIKSILNQTEERLELILILDNPDNKELDTFLTEYKSNDSRIRFEKNEKNIGIGLTLNRGIDLSKYDIIARLDADDISLPDRLEIQLDYLNQYPNVSMVSTNCVYIDENGNLIGEKGDIPEKSKQVKKLLPFGSTIIHSSVMYRKKDIQKIGGYRQLLNCQDYDLWLRMLDNGLIIESINQKLTKYRIREGSITSRQALRSMLTEVYVRELHKERINHDSKNDSFSFENYITFLEKNKCNNKKSKEKYLKASQYYSNGISSLQKGNLLKGIYFLICSLVKDRRLWIRIKNMYFYRKTRKEVMGME